MNFQLWFSCGCALTLAACGEVTPENGGRANPFIQKLPEGVLAIAAPYQDLTTVKIEPTDGCYVYQHIGPVETTFLPLRSVNGRPICTKAA